MDLFIVKNMVVVLYIENKIEMCIMK